MTVSASGHSKEACLETSATEIRHSEPSCLEHERDQPGTGRGGAGDNRQCEARARCQEEGVLGDENDPFVRGSLEENTQ